MSMIRIGYHDALYLIRPRYSVLSNLHTRISTEKDSTTSSTFRKITKYVLILTGAGISTLGCFYLSVDKDVSNSRRYGVSTCSDAADSDDKYIYISTNQQDGDNKLFNDLKYYWFIFKAKYLSWLSSIGSAEDVQFSVIWNLLQSFEPRFQNLGIQLMTKSRNWKDFQCRMVGQVCSENMLVKLARSPIVDTRYFLPMAEPPPLQNELDVELSKHVMSLTGKALSGYQPDVHKKILPSYIHIEEEGLENARFISAVPEEKTEIDCLENLAHLSMDPKRLKEIYDKGGLLLLHHIVNKRQSSLIVKQTVSRILANLSIDPVLSKTIVKTGWLSHIVPWTQSENLCLSLQAIRILGNLDRQSSELYKDGIYLLYPVHTNSEPLSIDIVFVHGLRGGPFKTWRQQDLNVTEDEKNQAKCSRQEKNMKSNILKTYHKIHRKIKAQWKLKKSAFLNQNDTTEDYTYCWPKDWLAKDCEDSRILSVEAEAEVHMWAYGDQRKTLKAQGEMLASKLSAANIGCRPIVWIGHSMGGLLIKQILTLSDSHPELEGLTHNTTGVVFISTPHKGSPVANEASRITSQTEIQEMRTDSEVLLDLHTKFINLAKERKIQCLSFGETEVTPILRQKYFKKLIVPPHYSDPGIGEFHALKRNHLYICKPRDRNSQLYKLIINFIQQCAASTTSPPLIDRFKYDNK